MSGVASTRPRIKPARASIRPERRSPPSAFGRASPCRRSNPRQRIALDALTPKRCAACLHESPPAIAASTRVLRSSDSAFDMSAGLRPADSLNHRCPDLGIAPSHSARITLQGSLVGYSSATLPNGDTTVLEDFGTNLEQPN